MEAGSVAPGVLRRAWAQAVTTRVAIAKTIPEGGRGLVVALCAANLFLGLLPVLFVIATSVVIGRVPAAVDSGLDSEAWDSLVTAFLLAAASFVALQVITTFQVSLGELLKRRVDGRLRDRTMALTLSSTGVGVMEESSTLDALREATFSFESDWHTPGMACAGLLALVARYLRLIGFVVIVGVVFSWVAAVALFGATMTFRYGQRGGLRKFSQVWGRIVPLLRKGDYLRGISLDGSAAKENKVFGLSDWLAGRYIDTFREILADVWSERRRIYLWPYVGFTAIGLTIATTVLVWIARSAAAGDVTLTHLALAMQASVAALLLGEHYPESDVATQFGMRAVDGLRGVEAAMARVEVVDDGPVPSESLARVAGVPRTAVRCAGVSFSYPGSTHRVLDELELELPAGICTAIVGVNGAGKTTLVKLLTRLYDPGAGVISVDGMPIRELDVRAWRRQVSVIFQDFIHYELTAADNIALGAAYAPRDPQAIRRAAERAGALAAFEHLPWASTRLSGGTTKAASTSRVGSGSGSRSPGRSTPSMQGRACSCSTSRPRRSMSGPRRRSSTRSSISLAG